MTVLKHIQPKIHGMTGGLFANWMPNNSVSIGDFGAIRRCAFERLGSLKDYGVKIEAVSIEGGKNDLEYKDRSAINAGASTAAADALTGAEGTVAVRFSGRGAFLYHLSDVDQQRPKNMKVFHERMGKALLAGLLDFPEDGVLVTEVQQAGKATIVVSDSNSGFLEFKTKFKPVGEAFLSGAKGKVSAGASTGSLFQWIANEDTVTLLRLVRPVFPPPPGGPGSGKSVAEAVVKWIRSLVGGRKLHVGELPLVRYIDGENPSAMFRIADTGQEVTLSFNAVTVTELLETDQEAATIGEDESANIEIEQVAYQRSSGTATG